MIIFLTVFYSPEVSSCLMLSFALFSMFLLLIISTSMEISSNVLWTLYTSYKHCFNLGDLPRLLCYISVRKRLFYDMCILLVCLFDIKLEIPYTSCALLSWG